MGKDADQAVNGTLATIQKTKAQIERDVQALKEAGNDAMGSVMSLAGSSDSRVGAGAASGRAGAGGLDPAAAAAAAKDIAPKAAAAVGALGLTGFLAKRRKNRRAAQKVEDAKRKDARIRAEELARAFSTMPAMAAGAHMAAEDMHRDAQVANGGRAGSDEDGGGGGKTVLGVVLLVAAAAGAAAVWFNGRR